MGIGGPDQGAARRHQGAIALLARRQRRLDLLARGDVALRAPGADQASVADDADHVVEEVAALAVPAQLVRLGVGDPVAPVNEGAQILEVGGVGPGEQLAERRADDLARALHAVHPGHRVVALGEIGVGVDQVDLLVGREADVDRCPDLAAPDALRGLLDEGAIALFTGLGGSGNGSDPAWDRLG
jgi:hypothetical protein